MTSRDFAYWLQGFFEISGESLDTIKKPQLDQIKKHLNMVFVHEIDPSHGGQEWQDKLNALHDAPATPPLVAPVAGPSKQPWPASKNKPGGPVARC